MHLRDVDELSSYDSDGDDVSCITTNKVEVDAHALADEPGDVSADETDPHEISSPATKSGKGDYVLVRFAKKQRCSYYAGKILSWPKKLGLTPSFRHSAQVVDALPSLAN
ncbi:hypothetical protein LSAT2_023079 [Lamellibrachia satsuma]|nr:hypothetical protein LSAT2_023079 [Lamellibrachia satsuma]